MLLRPCKCKLFSELTMSKFFLICITVVMQAFVVNAQIPAGFVREMVAEGLNPTSMTMAPDGRIFIVEKHGVIRIIRDDVLLPEPFLQIKVDNSNERGLGHMVLHPDFDQTGYYYVYYSVFGGRNNRISRFTAIGDKTLPESEKFILETDPVSSDVHHGGAMCFGKDGYLYITSGDGNVSWKAEDLASPNGKILRIDAEGLPAPDNPFRHLPWPNSAYVYAYGLRNPYTLTQHPVTGEIYVNDVGGNDWEEVNRIEIGAFFGWPKVEGKRTTQVVPDEYRDPVYAYRHQGGYCAIVGSTFYAPEVQAFPPEYVGRYFYSDYCTGKIRMLDPVTWLDMGVFIGDGNRVISLAVTRDGAFYYLERRGMGDGSAEDNTGTENGVLWRVTYTGSGAPHISSQPQSKWISAGENVSFHVNASGQLPLTYTWYRNGEVVPDVDGSEWEMSSVSYERDGDAIWVEVSNTEGAARSDTAYLHVTLNQRPSPEIVSPQADATYTGGSMIAFSGQATDPEEGILSPASLSWKIDFHHGTHTHPAMPWTTGISSGTWQIPMVGETSTDVWYRIYLRAEDSEGLTQTVFTDVRPQLGSVTIKTQPSGLDILVDGAPVTTPIQLESVQGVSRFIAPPNKQIRGDSVFFFRRWADGSPDWLREVTASTQSKEYIGQFDGIRKGKGEGLTVRFYNNTSFSGDPVATTLDPVVHHFYYGSSPHPDVSEDNFSVVWKGYIQPYRSGMYTFTMLADDSGFMSIDGYPVIQNWQPGVIYEKGSIYLESGRLYPIQIRLVEYSWFSQISLQWSSDDFADEVVPTSQLYPEDFEVLPKDALVVRMTILNQDKIGLQIESDRESVFDYIIVNYIGQEILSDRLEIITGKNEVSIDIRSIPQGLYLIKLRDHKTGLNILHNVTSFVKAGN